MPNASTFDEVKGTDKRENKQIYLDFSNKFVPLPFV